MRERGAVAKAEGKLSPGRSRILRASAYIGTALIGMFIGVVIGPSVSDYLAIGQPDLRYTYDQLPENQRFVILDQLFDKNGNAVFLASVRLRVKNVAIKQGHIDKAEFVPFTMQTLPKIDVQGVDKRGLIWGETQTIEVRALFTVAVGPIGPPTEHKEFEVEVRLFDNTGRQVGRYVDGLLARMRLKASGDFTRTITPTTSTPRR
jgi:hypothetical protein